MSIFCINNDKTVELITEKSFKDQKQLEKDVQNIIKEHPEILGENLLIIAETLTPCEDSRKQLDLLALDKDGNLVVIELKRDYDGFHMDLQAIRYASMVRLLTVDNVIKYRQSFTNQNDEELTQEEIADFLNTTIEQLAEKLDFDHIRIMLINQDFSKEITNSVLWLNEQGLNIKCIKIAQYEINGQHIWDIDTIIPVKEAEEYQLQIRGKKASDQETKRELKNNRDYTKYNFNNKENLSKGRLVWEVIHDYKAKHQNITFEDLHSNFPKELQGSLGVISKLDSLNPTQQKDRFYTKDEEILTLTDGTQIAVCTQWGKDNIEKFIKHVKQNFGYTIIAQE